MGETIELTEAEKIAKNSFLSLLKEGYQTLCDDDETIQNFEIPTWCNEELYKRGQAFFKDNRAGIVLSNLSGLILLFSDPGDRAVFRAAGKRNNPITARTRAVTLLVHAVSWYENDLSDPKIFNSFKRIRKLHYLLTKTLIRKGRPRISQFELMIANFAPMGFALLRPHLLGIKFKDNEDKKAFVHFWAVVNHMLGIQDRFNLCLLPLEAFLIALQMIVRYMLLPLIQVENPIFKKLVKNYGEGLKRYFPEGHFEADIYTVRRLVSVPGYQYKVDHSKEVQCRSILTQADVDELNEYVKENFLYKYPIPFTVDIPLIEVVKKKQFDKNNYTMEQSKDVIIDEIRKNVTIDMLLGPDKEVTVRFINYEKDWPRFLNDSKFRQLSIKGQFLMRWKYFFQMIYTNFIGRFLIERVAETVLYFTTKLNIKYMNENEPEI